MWKTINKTLGLDAVQRGFTVIELMIIVAIAGVLSVVAIPYMQDLISNQRVRAAVTEMQLSLLLARSEAIKRNEDVSIVPAGGDWEDGWTVEASGSTVLRTVEALNDKITLACNTDNDVSFETCPATLIFERTGRAKKNASETLYEFRLYETGNPRVSMRCVSVTLSGQPDIVLDLDYDSSNGCNN